MVVELEPDRPTMYWTFDDLGLAEQAGYKGEMWLDEPRISSPLHLPVTNDCGWMRLPVVFLIVGMGITPFLSAVADYLCVQRIGGDLAAVIFSVPLPLAFGFGADALVRAEL